MEKLVWEKIKQIQDYRTKKLSPLATPLISQGVTANHLTALSLLIGILASYFFLNNWWLLLLFSVLHLFFDSLDGVVARLTTEALYGKYFDLSADALPIILILIKTGWYLQDIFSYLVAGLFTLSLLIFFSSKLQATFIPIRTVGLLLMIMITSPLFQEPLPWLLTITYLLGGIVSAYTLARQLQWWVNKQISRKLVPKDKL